VIKTTVLPASTNPHAPHLIWQHTTTLHSSRRSSLWQRHLEPSRDSDTFNLWLGHIQISIIARLFVLRARNISIPGRRWRELCTQISRVTFEWRSFINRSLCQDVTCGSKRWQHFTGVVQWRYQTWPVLTDNASASSHAISSPRETFWMIPAPGENGLTIRLSYHYQVSTRITKRIKFPLRLMPPRYLTRNLLTYISTRQKTQSVLVHLASTHSIDSAIAQSIYYWLSFTCL